MALRIRLKRNGRNKLPVYRLVVTQRRWWRGKVIDDIGSFDPKSNTCVINFYRLQLWLLGGATMTQKAAEIIEGAVDAYEKIIQEALKNEPWQ